MSFSSVPPPRDPASLLGSVRRSCAAAREAAGIFVSRDAVERFLLCVLPEAPSEDDVAAWLTTGFRLPLAYATIHDEVNVLAVLCFLNSLSGYRSAFHTALGQGAHKVIVQIVMGLYIGDAASAQPLSADTLAAMTPMGLLNLLGLPTHSETPHERMPAVVVGKRRRDAVYEALETLCIGANDTGKRLKDMRCPDLGVFVERTLKEAASEGRDDGERASIFVSKLTTALPAFNDAHRLPNGNTVYVHKRVFLLLSWMHAAFHARREATGLPPIPDPSVLPAFIDNVLPSLLVHFGVLNLDTAQDTVLRDWAQTASSKVSAPPKAEDGAQSSQVMTAHIQDGPTLSRDEAYTIRAAALDAIHTMAQSAHTLAKEKDRPWLAHINESLLDAWLWTQAKRPDLTAVPRMVEKKTFMY